MNWALLGLVVCAIAICIFIAKIHAVLVLRKNRERSMVIAAVFLVISFIITGIPIQKFRDIQSEYNEMIASSISKSYGMNISGDDYSTSISLRGWVSDNGENAYKTERAIQNLYEGMYENTMTNPAYPQKKTMRITIDDHHRMRVFTQDEGSHDWITISPK